jgi:hypothetical protein
MLALHVLCLEGDDLALAYPLVRTAVRVGSEQWLGFASELIVEGGGVIGAKADGKCLYGLATFRPVSTLRHGRALYVELLVAIDLGRRQSVREVLQRNLNAIARERGCPSIVLTVPVGTRADVCESWQANGYVKETSVLVREVAA